MYNPGLKLMLPYSAIFNSSSDPNAAVAQPVLQCVQVKPLAGQQGAPERFRVVFSDINNFVQSMLATRMCCLPEVFSVKTY